MNPIASIINYVRSSKAELEKVSWPSRQETIRYGVLVIIASVFVAVFFSVLDMGLGLGIDALLERQTQADRTAETEQTAPSTNVNVVPDIQATTPDGRPANVQVTPLDTPPSGGFTISP